MAEVPFLVDQRGPRPLRMTRVKRNRSLEAPLASCCGRDRYHWESWSNEKYVLTGIDHKWDTPFRIQLRQSSDASVLVLPDGTINGLESVSLLTLAPKQGDII